MQNNKVSSQYVNSRDAKMKEIPGVATPIVNKKEGGGVNLPSLNSKESVYTQNRKSINLMKLQEGVENSSVQDLQKQITRAIQHG